MTAVLNKKEGENKQKKKQILEWERYMILSRNTYSLTKSLKTIKNNYSLMTWVIFSVIIKFFLNKA